jgi:subtilisin family serine protease
MKILTALLSVLFASTSFSQTLQNDNGWRPAWGLDRIDQREAELNDTYNYTLTGAGVSVYVFDSGINSSHEEFTGRIEPGFNVINDAYGTEDCSGHGSHTASLIGGTTYGVAKQVKLIPVRVLNCRSGNSSSATLYTAINWVIEHHQTGVPAIINLSVGMSKSMAFNEAAQALIADGLIVVGAAGNQNRDACLYSPASEPASFLSEELIEQRSELRIQTMDHALIFSPQVQTSSAPGSGRQTYIGQAAEHQMPHQSSAELRP